MAGFGILILFAVTVFAADANEYCNMRSLCPQREHLGCSFNEKSWSVIRTGPIPMKRSSDITADEKQEILMLHNEYRRATAYGLNDTQNPPRTVANMRELRWNEELAYLARIRVTLFNLGRSGSDCANLPKYQVGMNQHTQSFPVAPTDSTPWPFITNYWYSYSRFVASGLMTDLGAFRDIAQFAQMLWPTTYEMGCAANSFLMPGAFMRNIICYYGPVAKCYDDTNPFIVGPAASQCPDGTVPNDGLCSFSKTATSQGGTGTATSQGGTGTATSQEDTGTATSQEGTATATSSSTTDDSTTTTSTEGSVTPSLTDDSTTTTTTEKSAEGSVAPSFTDDSTTTTTSTEGSVTPSLTDDSTTTTTTEGSVTPSSTDDSTTTTTTKEPATATSGEESTSTTTTTTTESSDGVSLEFDIITPTPTPVITPCNNSTSAPDAVPIKDPQGILIAVLRYICQLLAINPPDGLMSQLATAPIATVTQLATAI